MSLSVLASPAANAQVASPIAVRETADLGSILTDTQGKTLYLFTKDAPGVSNCYDQCAVQWPPLLTDGPAELPANVPGVLATTPRNDGTTQVTYNGSPLYYWIADQQPGDTTGQNVGGVWFVLNPAPAPTVNVRSDGQLGDMLVDSKGMSLYLFTKDEAGLSNCYDQCAVQWPPLLSNAPTGPETVAPGLGTTERNDGTLQVTYKGEPLYYWIADQKPADTTGQNVGGVWFVVAP